MTIYIDSRRVSADWQPKPSVTSVGYISLYSDATLTLPDSVTSVGDIRLYSDATLTLPPDAKVKGHPQPSPELARERLVEVARHALAKPSALKMGAWHNESPGTSHSIAGWAVHLAGEAGYALEAEVKQPAAGNILLGVEASKLFFLPTEEARSVLHRILREAGEEVAEEPVQ